MRARDPTQRELTDEEIELRRRIVALAKRLVGGRPLLTAELDAILPLPKSMRPRTYSPFFPWRHDATNLLYYAHRIPDPVPGRSDRFCRRAQRRAFGPRAGDGGP